MQIDWDSLSIRVIVIAPSFLATVPRMATKIGYPVDLVQLQRFSLDDDELVLVEVLENAPSVKVKTTKTMGEWDWAYYVGEHGDQATAQFRRCVEDLAKLVEKKAWGLPYNLNKFYTGFKLGNKVVFSVSWASINTWEVRAKVSPEVASQFSSTNWEYRRYDHNFNEANFRVKPKAKAVVEELEPILSAAYRQVSGQS